MVSVPPSSAPCLPHRLEVASSLVVLRWGAAGGGRGAGAVLPFSGSSGSFAGVAGGGSAPGGFRTTDLGDKKCWGSHGAQPPWTGLGPHRGWGQCHFWRHWVPCPQPMWQNQHRDCPQPRHHPEEMPGAMPVLPQHWEVPKASKPPCPGTPRTPTSPPALYPVLGTVLVGSGTQRHLPFASCRLVLINADPLCEGTGAQWCGGVPSPLS